MNLIVCGEALWVSCGTWIAFWNGAIGAFVAAVLGGVVALMVVRLANAHQTHGLERSLEISAIADFVSTAEGLLWDLRRRHDDEGENGQELGVQLVHMRAASTRFEMARSHGDPVAALLRTWHARLGHLILLNDEAVDANHRCARDIRAALAEVIGAIGNHLPNCASRDSKVRASAFSQLQDTDEKLKTFIRRYEVQLRAAKG